MTDYRDKGRGNDRKLTPPVLLLPSPQGSWRESCASGHDPSKVKEVLWRVVELCCGYSKAEEGAVSEKYVIFIINGNWKLR